jgi:hypothetical protein
MKDLERQTTTLESNPQPNSDMLYIPNTRLKEKLPPITEKFNFSGLSFTVGTELYQQMAEKSDRIKLTAIGTIGGGISGFAFSKAIVSRFWNAVNKNREPDYRNNSAVIVRAVEVSTKAAPVIASAWLGAKYPAYGIASAVGVAGAGIISGLGWLNRNVTEPMKKDRHRGMK